MDDQSDDVSCSSDGECMSSDEEDMLDKLLNGEEESGSDQEYEPSDENCTQSTQSQFTDSLSQEPVVKNVFSWQDGSIPDKDAPKRNSQPFQPAREPGIHLGRITRTGSHMLSKPIDFLKLFLTAEFIIMICIATNGYAEMRLAQGHCMTYASEPGGTWVRVTEEEMYRFIGIVLYMSVVKFNSIARYWSTSPLYRSGQIQKVMSRTRFQAILSFLQVQPVADVDKSDKLTRIAPFIDHLNNLSKEFYQPQRSLSVDERMLPSKHHFSGIRQFVKDKPILFGLKLWVLACSCTGYTWNFFVYLGKKRTTPQDRTAGLAYTVVTRLCTQLFHQGYYLFVDNFYTTQKLIKELLVRKIYLIGTVKSKSTAMPDEFKDWKKWDKAAVRGDFRWLRKDDFAVVQWKDTKVVTAISTVHEGSATTQCERAIQGRTGWKKKHVLQPTLIHDYNQGMGGVDLSNQMSLQYASYIRSQYHWWKVLFFHCLDICIYFFHNFHRIC